MLLVAEQLVAPYDLLGQALGVPPARVRAITARWRGAGYAVTGVLGPGPAWCWLTPQGIAATGHAWPARPPSLSRLAYVRPGGPRRPAVAPGGPRLRRRRGATRPDASIIDELPYATANLTDAPEHVKAGLYHAFDIQALYRQPMKQATITDDTPGTVAALLTDPRTDNDTFGNLQPAAIATSSIQDLSRANESA